MQVGWMLIPGIIPGIPDNLSQFSPCSEMYILQQRRVRLIQRISMLSLCYYKQVTTPINQPYLMSELNKAFKGAHVKSAHANKLAKWRCVLPISLNSMDSDT
jgi:hypothetical protein